MAYCDLVQPWALYEFPTHDIEILFLLIILKNNVTNYDTIL